MNSKALDHFLASVERRAFRIAMLGVRNEESALDIVQDAMMRLAEKYAQRPEEEWPMLFQRILQNAILDHHRRQKVRRAWVSLFGDLLSPGDSGDGDSSAESSEFDMPDAPERQPDAMAMRQQSWSLIEGAITALPLRQQQAFVLRYWEGMDIAQTAAVMGCSEGSVKTHCSRAVKALEKTLAELNPNNT